MGKCDHMHATTNTLQVPPESIDAAVQGFRQNTMPALQNQEGFRGLYFLVNREEGKILAVTLWTSLDLQQQAFEATEKLRSGIQERSGAGVPPVFEHYEVALEG
jgi:heme-degrading monooxygenase HmoA